MSAGWTHQPTSGEREQQQRPSAGVSVLRPGDQTGLAPPVDTPLVPLPSRPPDRSAGRAPSAGLRGCLRNPGEVTARSTHVNPQADRPGSRSLRGTAAPEGS